MNSIFIYYASVLLRRTSHKKEVIPSRNLIFQHIVVSTYFQEKFFGQIMSPWNKRFGDRQSDFFYSLILIAYMSLQSVFQRKKHSNKHQGLLKVYWTEILYNFWFFQKFLISKTTITTTTTKGHFYCRTLLINYSMEFVILLSLPLTGSPTHWISRRKNNKQIHLSELFDQQN